MILNALVPTTRGKLENDKASGGFIVSFDTGEEVTTKKFSQLKDAIKWLARSEASWSKHLSTGGASKKPCTVSDEALCAHILTWRL